MKKEYTEIEFRAGCSIVSAIEQLHTCGFLACGSFNGRTLYSDIDDVDSAYVKIVGKSKTEFDAEIKAYKDKREEDDRKHKEAIPVLTKEWIEKGRSILDAKYIDRWVEIVPMRLNDLYRGMELKCCLDIIAALNDGCFLEDAKYVVESQSHSGVSFRLVCAMVREFCDRGDEFVKYMVL